MSKAMSKTPSLQFTHDERFAFLLATNEVRIYAVDQLGPPPKEPRYIAKLHLPKLASFSLPARASSSSGRGTYFFTAFCSGTKDQPAKVSLHEYRPTTNDVRAVMGKSLFQAEEMKSHWSPTGDAALVTLQTSVDASGESYYGSSQLFLLSASVGATTAEVVAVPVQAPVLDVAWMPHPSKPPCFAVVSGKMPALTTLHHGQTAQQTFIFGNDHRNTIAWAPHGRFVMLAGFGNLAGGMGFWDRNKMKLIPHSPANANNQLRAANSTAYGWSPDSRLFVTATCSPRLNVDNGIRLWRYTGEEVKTVPWDNATFQPDKLLQAQFVPSLLEVYPDRPQSPTTLRATGGDGPTDVSGPNTVAPAPPPPKATTAYVPPSARNRAAGSAGRGPSLAERLRREKEEGLQQARRVVVPPVVTAAAGATAPGGRVIPGLAPAVKSKNAIKREKTKLKKQQQEETAGLASDAPVSPEPAQGQGAPPPPEENALDPEKRIRKLKKALKQIEEIKQRAETDLNDDQKSKLANEAKIRADLQELGAPP